MSTHSPLNTALLEWPNCLADAAAMRPAVSAPEAPSTFERRSSDIGERMMPVEEDVTSWTKDMYADDVLVTGSQRGLSMNIGWVLYLELGIRRSQDGRNVTCLLTISCRLCPKLRCL